MVDVKYEVPIYDPVSGRGDNFYHPRNEAAYRLIHVKLAFNDIERWLRFLSCAPDHHGRLLIGRGIIIDCLELDKHLGRLLSTVLRPTREYELTQKEEEILNSLWGQYRRERKAWLHTFERARNKVAAHRDPLPLDIVAELLDQIDLDSIVAALSPVPNLFNCLKDLNVYEWSKVETDELGREVIALVAPFKFVEPEITEVIP